MLTKLAAVAALAAILVTLAPAQTAAELLQKGIYAQQTTGDVDGAIQIYRQVIATSGDQRALAGQAQMLIVGAMLQKGDLSGAAQEFRTLVTEYADQKDLITSVTARMGGAVRAATPAGPPKLTRGTLENGVYHNTTTGIEFRLPAGWLVTGDGPAPGEGEGVVFAYGGQQFLVWLKASDPPLASLPLDLHSEVEYKVHQRIVDGVKDFKEVPGTRYESDAGSPRQSLSVAFEYDGGKTMEYDTWIRNVKASAYFRTIGPASQIYGMQDSEQLLVKATTLP